MASGVGCSSPGSCLLCPEEQSPRKVATAEENGGSRLWAGVCPSVLVFRDSRLV